MKYILIFSLLLLTACPPDDHTHTSDSGINDQDAGQEFIECDPDLPDWCGVDAGQ